DRVGGQGLGDDAVDAHARAPAHGPKQTELVIGPETMVWGDVVLSDGEQRERAVRHELGMAVSDRRPCGLDGAVLGEIDRKLFAPERFTVPGEETDPDAHDR